MLIIAGSAACPSIIDRPGARTLIDVHGASLPTRPLTVLFRQARYAYPAVQGRLLVSEMLRLGYLGNGYGRDLILFFAKLVTC